MIIDINGKVSDMFFMSVTDKDGDEIQYDGYVPSGMGIGGGDYIEFSIDNETGQIVNWKTLTKEEIEKAFS